MPARTAKRKTALYASATSRRCKHGRGKISSIQTLKIKRKWGKTSSKAKLLVELCRRLDPIPDKAVPRLQELLMHVMTAAAKGQLDTLQVAAEPVASAAAEPQALPATSPPRTLRGEPLRRITSARGQSTIAAILNRSDMLPAEDFGALLNISRETVNRRRQERKILALQGTKRGYPYPAWQLTKRGQPQGLRMKWVEGILPGVRQHWFFLGKERGTAIPVEKMVEHFSMIANPQFATQASVSRAGIQLTINFDCIAGRNGSVFSGGGRWNRSSGGMSAEVRCRKDFV